MYDEVDFGSASAMSWWRKRGEEGMDMRLGGVKRLGGMVCTFAQVYVCKGTVMRMRNRWCCGMLCRG